MDGHRPLTLADDPVASIFLLLVFLFSFHPFGLFSSFLLPIQLGKLGRRRRLSLVVVFS
jgi:hypothetical protein